MKFKLRSGKQGIELRLHELEAEIMDVVWQQGFDTFVVGDVLHILEQRRDIAYTTVMTTVSRLYDKGLLLRERQGRRYVYQPAVTRESFLEGTAREVLDRAIGGHQALAMLSEKVSEASARELDELELLIQKRRSELGK